MVREIDIEAKLLQCSGVYKQYQEAWDANKFMIVEKMFAFLGNNKVNTPILTIKMQPQEGAYYRENYHFITEGYYMNKIHWISLSYENVDKHLINEIIDKSYENFICTLPKRVQTELKLKKKMD